MGTYIRKYNFSRTLLLLTLICFWVKPTFAQDGSEKQPLPKISLGDIRDIVKYDPETGNYLYFRQGAEDKPYKVLSKEDFERESVTQSVKESFQRKREQASEGVTRGKGLLPKISTNIDSEVLGGILGGNDVNLEFNGQVEILFGIKSTKINNPVLPPEYRRTTTPDFRTQYKLNLMGNLGSKINFNFNFDPNNSFGFDTDFKIGYAGDEDAILQNIEVGYVALPVNSTLISGSQSLFGAKLGLRFGRLDMDLVASQQKGESKTIEVKGGAQSQFFDMRADEYETNRHFFLTHHFRDNYEKSLSQLPLIVSGINITRLEVWVTNRANSTDDVRNVVAFMDLAETNRIHNNIPGFGSTHSQYPSNGSNGMYNALLNQYNIRNFAGINNSLKPLGPTFYSGQDYEKLERARRLRESEYSYNPQLGYISLNTSLNNDEVLAVAFEYTINGQVFKVGELSTSGTTGADSTLVLKLLKGTVLTPKLPTWDLMMKNVYRLDQAYNLEERNFILDIFYEDSETGAAIPYIPEGPKANIPLINVLNLDKLNTNRDAYPDGIFDFVEGVTVQKQNGRIIFPVLEPFGRYLEKTFKGDPSASKYVFKELYDSTLTKAKELSHKNKFRLQGSFESSSQSEIRLDAMNIPEGSVVVTAGGTKLIENIDYQVNYLAGTVTITNPGYLESGIPIQIKLESRNTFNLQTKTLLGANLNYRFSENFRVGGTILHLSEKPMTQKVAYNEDPVSNTIWGLNTSFKTESEGITKLLSKIMDTKAKSSFFVEAEVANLIAGQPRGIKGKLFIDDFEGTKSSLDLRNYLAWSLASVPQGQTDLFPEGDLNDDLKIGYNRAKLAWNWIDPELLRKPISYMRQNPDKYLRNHWVREIAVKEIYPHRSIEVGLSEHIQTLNLNFYPRERGPYNYDIGNVGSNGFLNEPETRWGGIMRSIPITDFESANYDYIEFWVMDPFVYNKDPERGGDFYINLGTLSEDVLKDGYKSYEQGIPYPMDLDKVIATAWGYVPKDPALVNNFDNSNKANKDVGLDGLSTENEHKFFSSFVRDMKASLSGINAEEARNKIDTDPSSDNFMYYKDGRYDSKEATILERYKDFNNPEGNSSGNEIYTNNPDMEDINRDNTMEENETYYQYKIPLKPNMKVGENFIAEAKDTLGVTWYQFKVPLNEYQKAVGPISDFKSVRFMRMYLRGFKDTTILRFASLELVRSEWRKYGYSLVKGQEGITTPEVPNSSFEVSVVNIEENSQRAPVNYVMPPNTERTVDPSSYQERELNEQSMQLTVRNLPDGDGRAVYKTLDYDFRQYRRMQMDVHAESYPTDMAIHNGDLSLFVRLGSDLINNYYEYEIPLKVTPVGYYSDNQRYLVWPEENKLDIDLSVFSDIKMFRNTSIKENGGAPNVMYEKEFGDHKVRVKGNPNLGEIRTMMIGVNNPIDKTNTIELGLAKSGTVWVNELRLSDFENKGGWAAAARTGVQLADLGSVTLSGTMMTAGFGGLEQRQSERSQEDVYSYDVMANLNLGKFFNPKVGVQIPVFFGISERFANPLYDPLSKDVKYKDAMKNLSTKAEKDSLRNLAQDYTRRKSFNITNLRVAPEGSKGGILSISNLSLSFSFNELFSHNINLERMLQKDYRGGLEYGYNISPKFIEPFKKIGFLQTKALKFIGEFNFNPVPNAFTFTTDLHRTYYERQTRNIAYPDAKIPATFSKDFTFNRYYNLNWNLAKSLNFTYSATNIARIDEPEGMVDKKRDREGYKHWRDSIRQNIFRLGRTVNFNHNFMFAWQLPINKLYGLDWVNGQASYAARYNWNAAPVMRENEFGYEFDPGNIIDNGRTMTGNVSLDFTALYNKSGYLKGVNDQFDRKKNQKKEKKEVVFESRKLTFTAGRRRVLTHDLKTTDVKVEVTDPSGKKLQVKSESSGPNKVILTVAEGVKGAVVKVTGKVEKAESTGKYAMRFLTRLAMAVRRAELNYTQDESSILPGFKGETKLFGLRNFGGRLAPGLSYIMGGQASDFAKRARDYGWLTGDTTMTNPYVMRKQTNLTFRIAAEPIKDLQITLNGMRTKTSDLTSFDITRAGGMEQLIGGFQITTVTIGTAFERNSGVTKYSSNAFEKFNKSRKAIAGRLARERQQNSGGRYNPGGGEFPDGYSGAAQDVLLPAFRAAYMGGSASGVSLSNFWNIPLPNWQISYQGFAKAEAFKKYFNSGRITHSYSSIYSVNAFNRNADYSMESDGFSWIKNELGNFITQDNILNVSIQERFNPLFGLDLGWKNDLTTGFRINKNRLIGLSLANNQVVEAKNSEFSIELGYFFRKVPLIFKFGENRQKKVDTDLKLTGRFSFGNERTFIRNLDETEREAQISAGNKIRRFNISADYTLYKGVMLRMFYDHDFTNPYITSISVSNTNFGFSLSFSLSE